MAVTCYSVGPPRPLSGTFSCCRSTGQRRVGRRCQSSARSLTSCTPNLHPTADTWRTRLTNRVTKSFGFVEFNHYEASTSIADLTCRQRDAESLQIVGRGHDGHENEDFDFEQTLRDIHTELADLNKEAAELAAKIQANFEELGA